MTTCTRADAGAGSNYTFLTRKERDNETGLDYFGARYYASMQGRFTSADPFNIALEVQGERDPKKAEAKLQIYLSLPQQWNRYSYAINNPLVYVDPTGEAIQLSSDPQERERQLQALKDAVGSGAAGYLYANQGKDGNWYVGIYDTNPTNGDTRRFGQVNDVASQISDIVADPQVAKLEMVHPGTVSDDSGDSTHIGTLPGSSPAATGYFKGQLTIKLLDWGKKRWWGSNFDLGSLPGALMSDHQDNKLTPSIMTAHELAHAWDKMCGITDHDTSNQHAVDFENKVRKLQNPGGPTRQLHNVPRSP
ncbi:MAG: RHS repeat-associated core domain-containing protein [Pyrinomonadaceae bacterium]